MTLRELHTHISTDNHATITVSKISYGIVAQNKHWGDIPKKYKDSAGYRWPDIPKSYKGALVATLWIKELDFTGCIMDCEVHFK